MRRELEGPGLVELWWDPVCRRAPAVLVLIGVDSEGFAGVAVPVDSISDIVEAMLGVGPAALDGCLGRVVVTPNLGSVDICLERERRAAPKQVAAGRLTKNDAREFAVEIRSTVRPTRVSEAEDLA